MCIRDSYYSVWISEQGDGNHRQALTLAKELLQLALNQSDSAPKVVAHRTVAWSEFNLGDPLKALEHHEASRSHYDHKAHEGQLYTYGTDHLIGVGSGQVQALWCAGQPGRAREVAAETLANAEESGHHASLFLAYQFAGCLLHTLCRNWRAVEDSAERLIALDSEIPQAGMAGQFYLQTLLVRRNRSMEPAKAGLDSIRAAQGLGYRFMMPFWMMSMADSCLASGFTDQAAEILGEAEYIIEQTEERWHLADIYRLQAEIAVKKNDHDLGAQKWRHSLSVANDQSALSWQLRTLMSIGLHGSRALANDTRPDLLRVLQSMPAEQEVDEVSRARAFIASS